MIRERSLSSCVCVFISFIFGIVILAGCGSAAGPTTVAITPQTVAIGTDQTTQLTAIASNGSAVNWTASAGTISASGLYTPPAGGTSTTATVTATSVKEPSKKASATVNVVVPGVVTTTANPQVASYTIAPAAAGNVSVQFGMTTSYGLTTWTQPVPTGGGAVSLFVAGMRGNTLYHIQGVVQFADGSEYLDPDMTFTTEAYPAAKVPPITATTTPGATPQGGVELLNLTGGAAALYQPVVTDLQGNVLWAYDPGTAVTEPAPSVVSGLNPIKMLPNGHFLMNFDDGATPDITPRCRKWI